MSIFSRNRCAHTWKYLTVDVEYKSYLFDFGQPEWETLVTRKCTACGHRDWTKLVGRWTLEALNDA